MNRARIVLTTLAVGAFAHQADAFCPSYTPQIANCVTAPVAGKNPSDGEWNQLFDLVGRGRWESGPTLATIEDGCSKPSAPRRVAARFPCTLLKAIAMQESRWLQFCVPDRPASQVGAPERTIVSFDCGYGASQVTSGMRKGETPPFDQRRVAAEALYNLQVGATILLEKWNAVACVGDKNPDILEHWYLATWAYNGMSFVNSPNNPNYAAGRPVYNPDVGGAYPYQEKVWGWLEYPPSPAHWVRVLPAYPDRATLPQTGAATTNIPEPACAAPTSCAQKRDVHAAACTGPGGVDGGSEPRIDVTSNETDAGVPLSADVDAAADGGCGCRATASRSPWAAALACGWLGLVWCRRIRRRSRGV